MPRSTTTVAIALLLLLAPACGGGDDDGPSKDVASDATDAPSTTTTTEAPPTTTAAGVARTDIEPCALLTADELAAQASVAGVDEFRVTGQEEAAAGRVAPGAFRCTSYFTVVNGSSEISANVDVDIKTKDAARDYKNQHEFTDREREDVNGLGDKAFYDVENGSITILDDDVLVIIDPDMPGIMKATNRPVAEAIAPIVLARL